MLPRHSLSPNFPATFPPPIPNPNPLLFPSSPTGEKKKLPPLFSDRRRRRRRPSHERFPLLRRHVPPCQHPHPPPEDLRHQILLWYPFFLKIFVFFDLLLKFDGLMVVTLWFVRDLVEDAGDVRDGVHGEVLGPVHRLHLPLQHGDEARLHLHYRLHRLVHACTPRHPAELRQGHRHLPPPVPLPRRIRARACCS